MIYSIGQTVTSVSLLMMQNWKEWQQPEGRCFLEPHNNLQGEVQSPVLGFLGYIFSLFLYLHISMYTNNGMGLL